MKTQVRNGLVRNFNDYVKAVYGADKYGIWLNNLKPAAKALYSAGRFAQRWYDAEEFYIEPVITMCKVFDKGHTDAAWHSGVWGVESWMKGRIKWMFEKLNTEMVMKTLLVPAALHYYRPVKIAEISVKKGEAAIYVAGMDSSESLLAFRFGGGMEKALQMKGCRDVLVQTGTAKRKGLECTAFFISWK